MFKLIKFLVVSGILLSFFVIPNYHDSHVLSVDYTENFNGSINNPALWKSHRSVMDFSFDAFNDFAIVSSVPDSNSFDYLKSVNLLTLKPDYSSIKLRVKFSNNSVLQGAGYILSDNTPEESSNLDYDSLMFFVWPKTTGRYSLFASICPESNPSCNVSNQISNGVYDFPNDFNWHDIDILRVDQHYEWFSDGSLIFKTVNTSRIIESIGIGNPENTTQGTIWPKLYIDLFGIDYQSIPTFPYLSQKDVKWGAVEYDSASGWAGPEKIGIERWGCALTSAAMVMQDNGVKSTTDKLVDPADLNTWLKSQDDGYIGLGLVNWITLSRYVHGQHTQGLSPTELEYERSYLPSTPTLPAIMDIGGHFVVAHGEEGLNWLINDPNDETKTELVKTTSVKSINRFVPSETDLSYMLFTLSPSATGVLTNSLGEIVPLNWIDEYIDSDMDETQSPTIKTAMLPKPANGRYYLHITQPEETSGEAKIYLYDELASEIAPTAYPLTGSVTDIQIDYASESAGVRSSSEVDLTAPSVPTNGAPHNAYIPTNNFDFTWDPSTDNAEGALTYEFQSTRNPAQSGGILTTGLWKSTVLPSNMIHSVGAPDGTWYWQVRAIDATGNKSSWSTIWQVTLDHVRPSADLVFPTPAPSSNYFDVVFSEMVNVDEATDSANYYLSNWPNAGGSGDLVSDATISYNPTTKTARITFTRAGWYISSEQMWGVQNIHDLAGNLLSPNPTSEYSTAMIPPTLTSAPSTNTLANSVTQVWSWLAATDSGSGVSGYSTRTYDKMAETYLNDWLWIGNVLSTTTNLGEGLWQLELKAKDKAGNESAPLVSNVVTVDTTNPSTPTNLRFDNPALTCGSYTNKKTITVDWDDASDNHEVAGYQYNIDYPTATGRGNWTTFFTTSSYRGSLNEGTHYIKIRTKDKVGNYSPWSESCAITYDSVMPVLTSKTSFDGWYSTPKTSYFDFSDQHMAEGYLAPNCEIGGDGTTQTCTVTPNVCDLAGNCYTTTLTSNPAKIDTTKPTVALNAWGSTIDGTASDNLSGLNKVELKILKPDHTEITVNATGTTNWTYTMSEAPYGDYRVVVASYDNAGNKSEETIKEFVMSPSAQASTASVAGASTGPSDEETSGADASKQSRSFDPIETDEEIASPSPRASLIPSPSPDGKVLGEADEPKSRMWWLVGGMIGIGALVFALIIYLTKKQ